MYYIFATLDWLGLRTVYGYDIGSIIHADRGAEVIPGIFIGSSATTSFLGSMDIDFIVNLSGKEYNCDIPIYNITMDDNGVTPETFENYRSKFNAGIEAITAHRNGNILVHCAAGINRSAALIGMYLIDNSYTYDQAMKLLTAANNTRGVPLLTNESFRYMMQLRESMAKNINKDIVAERIHSIP